MSCNSCSNITLPGVAGPTGAVGDAGATGPSSTITVGTVTSGTPAAVVDVGTPGAAQFNFTIPPGAAGDTGPNGVTILHYDVAQGSFSPTAIGTTNQTTATIKRAFSIPANTWEINGDMIELEIMAVGNTYETGTGTASYHRIYVDLDGNPIEMDAFFTFFGSPGFVYDDSVITPLLHLKLQLMLTDSGLKSILPITDFESQIGSYTELSSNVMSTYSKPGLSWKHRGVITTPGPALNAPITLNVSAVSADASVDINMFYAKITSYKKS